ncbi:MAG: efflux RND transporter periplasmic adaptor subunit [Planctomycetaceae bacterium]|nr:efflux RND transporter periplasmic adaptor subunit [Planctomycetaceae bacterium]
MPTVSRLRTGMGGVWHFVKIVGPITLGLCGLVLVIAWLAGAFEEKIEPGEHDVSVRRMAEGPAGEVHEVFKEYEEEALGTLKAADRTAVSSRVMARIDEMLVSADDVVEAGQTLARLEKDDFRARLNQAQESLTAATAKQTEARTSFQRIERLRDNNAATQSQFDTAKAAIDVAEADVRRAQQAVIEAETMLSFTEISAPRAGRIVDRLAEPGDMALPGQPLLTLYDPGSLRLEVPVREALALKLEPGAEVVVHIDALDRDFTGKVAQRVPQAEAASRSFLVKVDLPAADGLFEGMFGRLKIPVGTRRHLCLPTAAIREIGQLQFVDVIRPDDTLERRFIKTGRQGIPGKIEVLSGVEAGERVMLHDESDVHSLDIHTPTPDLESNKENEEDVQP